GFLKPRADEVERQDTAESPQEVKNGNELEQDQNENQEDEQQNDTSQQCQGEDGEWEEVKENEETDGKVSKNRKIEEDLAGESGKELIKNLKDYLKKSQHEGHRERIYAVKLYLQGIQAKYHHVWLRTIIAHLHGKGRHFADNIQKWALEFKRKATIPLLKAGCHPKLRSLLTYKPIKMGLTAYIGERLSPTHPKFVFEINPGKLISLQLSTFRILVHPQIS
ncbi:hypothetical protein BGX31_002892, partial [Mortierella sp. GBA43]